MSRDIYQVGAALVESECRDSFVGITDAAELVKIAFKAARTNWMVTDEDQQFKSGIGAVLIALKEGPEFERVRRSVEETGKMGAMLNALQQGIPVDLEAMLAQQEAQTDRDSLIPLTKLWHDSAPQRSGDGK